MKIRYMLPYPFMMDHGGGKALETGVINGFKKLGHDIQLFDWTAEKADFEILLVFGFTQQNPQVLEWIKRQGIKIIMVPVFDRLKPRLYHRAAVLAGKIIGGYDKIRYKNLLVSDLISVNNRFEADDIIKIYKIPEEKIQVNLLGLSDLFFEKAEKVSADLFIGKYGIKDFVYYPSARISRRKNQITFLKAVGGTNIPVVITGKNAVEEGLEKELAVLLKKSPNVLCIDSQDLDIHLSAYKAAKVSVSVSLSETAGLVNLEAAYLGCNLVLSDTPVYWEYIGSEAVYVNPKNPSSIKKAVELALQKPYNPEIKNKIRKVYNWDRFCADLIRRIGG